MPHLRFRSVTSEQVARASEELPQALALTMQTSIDNFTFERIDSSFFENGKPIVSYPFVEIWWFKRPQEVQDAAAAKVTQCLKHLTGATDIVVTFYEIPRENYYENEIHF